MQKTFTKIFATAFAALSFAAADAQTVLWPVAADTNTVNASQFKGAASIQVSGTHTPFWGWTTKGLYSDTLRKSDSAVWMWSSDGSARGGAYAGGRSITSPTAANGAAIFNSDFLDNRGVQGAFGAGQAPTDHEGELVSPIINIAGQNNVMLQFDQQFRNFSANCSVSWSEDGGVTWKTPIEINKNIASGATTTPQGVRGQVTMQLKNSVGTNNFRIKFIFKGDYYFWLIDDVRLIESGADVGVSFTAIPPNFFTPKSQVEPIYFLADVSNEGGKPAENVRLNVRVTRGTDTLYNQSLNYGRINPHDTVQNRILPGYLNLNPNTAVVGTYRLIYQVYTTSTDYVTSNDSIVHLFYVSDSSFTLPTSNANLGFRSTMAKDNNVIDPIVNRPADNAWTAGSPHSWTMGNIFHIKDPSRHTISHISAYIFNPGPTNGIGGQTVSLRLYKWNDMNNDRRIDANERTLLGAADSVMPTNMARTAFWFTKRIEDINASGTDNWMYLRDSGYYITTVRFTASTTGRDMFVGFSKTRDYNATLFLTDSLQQAGLVNGRRYGPALGIEEDGVWSTGAFGADYIPGIRMRMLPFRVNTNEVLPTEQRFEVYPNPATANLTLAVNFEKAAESIAVRILDITGREVRYMQFDNVQKDNYTLNVSDLANGTYMLQVVTEQGARAKKFVVQH